LRLSKQEGNPGRPMNPTVYSAKEFKQKIASGNHFLNAAMRGKKVFLMGSERELRKVTGKCEASSPGEIEGIVKRSLNDTKVTAISADLRFTGCLQCRPGCGHHGAARIRFHSHDINGVSFLSHEQHMAAILKEGLDTHSWHMSGLSLESM